MSYYVSSGTLNPTHTNSVRKSNDSTKQLFKLLSVVTNTRTQPSAPLIDGLVDDAVLQLSPDGDEALH